jgi:tetratricopeptide (TPR) repeat protein
MTDGASTEGKRVAIQDRVRWARCAVLGVVLGLVAGVYVWSAKSGLMELCAPTAENTYYNLLVRGLRDGQLSLKTEAPPGLAQLADPYDPTAGKPYRWSYGHSLFDLSYYKGKLYLYFGITPALVLFWPYAVLTGHYLLHKHAVAIFFSAGFLAAAGLLLSMWKRYFADVSFWIIVPCVMALGLANFAPPILARCDVYEVAISCGYAMTMLALAALWRAWHDPGHAWQWLAAASLGCGLAVGARPSLLFGAIILLAPVVQAWRQNRPLRPLLMAAAIPILFIGVGLMCYNALRFGNPLDFGHHYQLSSTRQDTVHQFSLRYLLFNSRISFLQPARCSGHFPFLHDIVTPTLPPGAVEPEHSFGVLTNIPLVWLALAAPLAWKNRSAEARSTLRWFIGAVALLCGVCALTINLYSIMCLRYELEFAHAFVLLAVIGILGLERALAGHPAWRRAARCGWGLLLVFSVAFNLFEDFNLQADAHFNLASVLWHEGKLDEAIHHYQKAVQFRPDFPDARNSLGSALRQQGRLDEALAQYQQALQLRPDSESAHFNLAKALYQKGNVDQAIAQFQSALQLEPADMEAQNNLAWCLATAAQASLRNGDKAVQLARQANELAGGKNPVILGTLAAAFAETGRFGDAVQNAQKAIQLAQSAGRQDLAAKLNGELRRYEAGLPLRQ